MRSKRSQSIYLYMRRVIKQTLVIIGAYYFCQRTYKILSNILLSSLTPYEEKIFGDYRCVF